MRRELAALEDEGVLHRAGTRYHWASETYPADHISLRTVTTDNFLVIDTTARDEKQTKKRQIIAEVDWGSAFATIYPKAIYLIESDALRGAGAPLPRGRGEGGLRQARGRGLLHRRHQRQGRVDPPAPRDAASTPACLAEQGEVLVAEKVVGFKKIKHGHAGERGLGRGRAAAAGDADDERVADACRPRR